MFNRRSFLSTHLTGVLLAGAALLAGCANAPQATGTAPAAGFAPIVFVHGNGDTAALWSTTIWRFESNGWPRDRLFALDMPYPQARDDDTKEQQGRSSTTEQRDFLAAEVTKVLAATGASQVVLIGNSRGGYTIRNFVASGGAAQVSHVVLGGTPNHGVWNDAAFRPNSEFNGAGPFLQGLNAPKGPDGLEVTPGPKWLTLRSDNNDKFAQPDGAMIGAKDMKTHVTADGPALKGAENVVLPARDHRETSYHAEAFAAAWRFLTGRAPSVDITPETTVVLDGTVTGLTGAGPTNLPFTGAQVQVFAVDPQTGERQGAALVDKTVDADGRWGPLQTDSHTALEFSVKTPRFGTTHIYRSPFVRSSSVVHLRVERVLDADFGAHAVVLLARPRGYFGLPRDSVVLDGKNPPPGVLPGVAGAALSRMKLPNTNRTVVGEFSSGAITERIAGRAWPADDKHVSVLELHY